MMPENAGHWLNAAAETFVPALSDSILQRWNQKHYIWQCQLALLRPVLQCGAASQAQPLNVKGCSQLTNAVCKLLI